MKKLVVLTGAGISAESGIPTFRDAGGLWDGYPVESVATPEAWERHPKHVLKFYNERRVKALSSQPNQGHRILAALQERFDVYLVTQNVDDLHERAGSKRVLHLHGSLFESRSTLDEELVYPIGPQGLQWGDTCARGGQLRPNIVWFGEAVPAMEQAVEWAEAADIFLVVGTSLIVYPAASLLHYVQRHVPVFIVDPGTPEFKPSPRITFVQEKASVGLEQVRTLLQSIG